jgi:hypothetical protein
MLVQSENHNTQRDQYKLMRGGSNEGHAIRDPTSPSFFFLDLLMRSRAVESDT